MLPREWIAAYCRQSAEQICWKRARPAVMRELEQHLQDQTEAYTKQGYEQEQDQAHRPQTPWFPLFVVLGLLALGAALQVMLAGQMTPLVSYGVAAGLFALGYFGDIGWLGKHGMKIYGGVLAGAVLLLIGAEPLAGPRCFIWSL